MRQIETPERNILTFLTRAWSGNRKAKFRWAPRDVFKANTKTQTIYICNYRDDKCYPDLNGFQRWRIWRFLTFHENMHLLLSPKMTPLAYVQSAYKSRDDMPTFISLIESLYQIFEDVRIEEVGLETYVGYLSEQRYYTAIAFQKNLNEARSRVKELQDRLQNPPMTMTPEQRGKTEFALWWFEFLSRLLFHKSLVTLEPELSADTDAIVKRAYGTQKQNEPLDLAFEVVAWLQKHFPFRVDPVVGETSMKTAALRGSGTVSPKQVKSALKSLGLNQEEIEEAMLSSEALAGEFDQLEREVNEESASSDDSDYVVDALSHGAPSELGAVARIPVIQSEQWDNLMSGAETVIAILKSNLRRWRVGWREVLAEEGEDLDAEAPILARLGHNGLRPKIFLDEKKVGSRGKLLILVDMSGSIQNFREVYLRAGGIIAEALAFVGATFELYCFNKTVEGGAITSNLWLIKTLNEKWSVEQRERLAGMRAKGDTPLHNVLALIRERVKRMNVRRLVILTDGCPDSLERATVEVRRLTGDGVKVLFLGVCNASLEAMQQMLDFKGSSERAKYIDELDELPRAFFDLLQASV